MSDQHHDAIAAYLDEHGEDAFRAYSAGFGHAWALLPHGEAKRVRYLTEDDRSRLHPLDRWKIDFWRELEEAVAELDRAAGVER